MGVAEPAFGDTCRWLHTVLADDVVRDIAGPPCWCA